MKKLHEDYEFHKVWNLVNVEGTGKKKLTQCASTEFEKISQNITKSQKVCGKTSERMEEFWSVIYGNSRLMLEGR
jgi:hypothetical protein